MANTHIQITLTKSLAKSLRAHKNAVKGLGIRKIGRSVIREDNPRIRGQVNIASHLLCVERVDEKTHIQ